MIYAEVLLPVPIAGAFTYRVPCDMESSIAVGDRVIVPFGRKKYYTGIVCALTPVEPKGYELKDIMLRIDDRPVVRHPQLKHWSWVADYYLCTPGEVYKAAVPAGLKIESETFISPIPGFEEDPDDRLTTKELALLEGLLSMGAKRVSLDALSKKTGISAVGPVVNSLLARNAVMISENLVERYHAKKETYVRLTARRGDSEGLHAAFDAVRQGTKQET
ncbi:MAG: primosomal protein N', partial [Bacteroides sp.]|nr:primosomal protein N' [Bacteroides sp.]